MDKSLTREQSSQDKTDLKSKRGMPKNFSQRWAIILIAGHIAMLGGCDQAHIPEGVLSSDGAQEPPLVHVYNWSDYIDEAILNDFEQETGIRVVYDVFDSNEVLETRLLAGGAGYDVVVPTAIFLERQIAAGAFQVLDREQLSHWDNQWQEIMRQTARFDQGNRYAINYMWGTTGIGYDVDKVAARLPDAPIDSWRMIFEPELAARLADCGIDWVDSAEELIPAALNYLGEDPFSHDPAILNKARDLLLAVRPYIRQFHSSEYINALAGGDICIAVGWSGDILQARQRAIESGNGVNIAYSIPREGARMWFDMMAIPADAPHPGNAHAFIDYILRDDVAAKASNFIYFANGNLAAQNLLNDDVISDPAIYPSPTVMGRLYTMRSYPFEVRRRITQLWTEIKRHRK